MFSKNDHQCDCTSLQNYGVNYHGLKLAIYINILVLVMLLLKNQKEAIYNLLLPNRWSNRETEEHDRSVSQSIYQLEVKQLGKIIANS